MTTPVKAPTGIAGILSKLNAALGGSPADPSNTALMGFAAGLGQASTPHMLTPVSGGQALGMAAQASQAYQHAALANELQQTALIPYQKARAQIATNVAKGGMYQLTPAEQAAVQSGKFTPQILSKLSGMETQLKVLGVNTDSIPIFREAETWAKNNVTPYGQPANSRTLSAAGAATGGAPPAQGPLPTGTAQGPGGAIAPLPGALPAIQGVAGAGAAGTFPYQSALKRTALLQGPVTNRVLSLAPAMPPLFNPGLSGGTPPQAPARPAIPAGAPAAPINPQALAAAQAAQRARQAALMRAAQQNGARVPGIAPGAPPGIPQNATGAPIPQTVPPHPAAAQGAPGTPQIPGTIAPGMTPAQVAMNTGQGKQAVEMNAGYQQQAENAKETLAQVSELRMSANDFAPGQFAEARIKGLQWMQSLGLITPKEEQELGSAQEGTKMSIQLQSTLTRSLGSREAAQVFATLGRGVPNLTLSPDGFGKMTAYMEGMARYNAARAARSQQYFNAGNYKGVNNVRDQYIANSNPAYFIIASAAPQIQREMVAQMGSKARPFLQKWAAATAAGWAPSPTAFASQP